MITVTPQAATQIRTASVPVSYTHLDVYKRQVSADQPNTPKQHWASFERMRRDDHQYEYGMVVEHNTQPVTPGRGSAIFLHVWLDPQTPTSGCTGMDRAHLLEVLRWLQPNANPLLVQVPAAELGRLSL